MLPIVPSLIPNDLIRFVWLVSRVDESIYNGSLMDYWSDFGTL